MFVPMVCTTNANLEDTIAGYISFNPTNKAVDKTRKTVIYSVSCTPPRPKHRWICFINYVVNGKFSIYK